MPDRNKGWKAEKGLALPGVVWAIIVLFLMTASVLNLTLGKGKQISAEEHTLKRNLAVNAAFATPIKELVDDRSGNKKGVLGKPFLYSKGEYEVSVSISAEAGKVNLNFADKTLLTALFVETGLSRAEGDALAEALIDYRKEEHLFKTLGEILEVRGMDRTLYAEIFPDITLYSNSSVVRPEYASERLLRALSSAGKEFTPGTSILKPAEFETGTTWRLSAKIKGPENQKVTKTWIIRLTGDVNNPFLLHWSS